MTRNKLALVISLLIGIGAIAGGIVYAQEASTPQAQTLRALLDAQVESSQEPGARNFTFFLDGGAFLGVGTEDISKENMARYGMREVRGVGVTEVVKDSPAEKAGLRKDDVILRFDGESVTSVRKLTRLVNESAPDQAVHLTVSRGGAEQELTATLTKRKMDDVFSGSMPRILRGGDENGGRVFPAPNWPPSIIGGDEPFILSMGGANRRIGVSTQTLTKQLADYFGVSAGVLVTSVTENSPAAKAGLKAGDVITAIDGEKVSSPGDLVRGIGKKENGDVSLTVVRDRNTRTVTITPEKNPQPGVLRPGTMGTRRIMIPSVEIPDVPEMNIRIPRIVVPATPPIDVTLPARAPQVVQRSRVVII